MSENIFDQKPDQPLFMAVKSKDPAFADAIEQAQRSLSVFRRLLSETMHSPAHGGIRMVKTFISEGNESMWLWLKLEADMADGFVASVFEAPPQFRSLKTGTMKAIKDAGVADWAIIDNEGHVHGGFSLRLARSRLPENERTSYDAHIGAKSYAPLPASD